MTAWAGRIILLWGWRQAGLAFLAGAIAVLALPPFDFIAAAPVSFVLLFLLLEGAIPKPHAGFFGRLLPAMKVGWWFGFGYFVAGLWWLGNALLAESDEFAWAIPLAVLALPAVLALFYALAAGFGPRVSAQRRLWVLALASPNGCARLFSPGFRGIPSAILRCQCRF
jgi:apolipoprotein N-acyltransferase